MSGGRKVTEQNPEDKYKALEKYGRDLVELARESKMDPVIGRDSEIRRVVQILSRRTKNNPVLIGEPGRRQDGDRRGPGPADRLRRRARVAQAAEGRRARHGRPRRRHQVSRRVRGATQGRPPRRRPRRRAGSSSSSTSSTSSSAPARLRASMDAANLLKPALARGELRCIGATTLDEYREHIEKDAALERRFQPVYVERAVDRGHDLDPPRPQGAVRGPPQGHDQGLGDRRGGQALVAVHHRPIPARQGHRPRRRGLQPDRDGIAVRPHRDRHHPAPA